MTVIHSSGRVSTALGYFMQGVPAIFVRTEIAAVADPDMLKYVRAYGAAVTSQRAPDFTSKGMLRGYESFITPIHELRHFHDALLCLPLFKLFLIQSGRLWHVTQLAGQISGLSASDLPLAPGKEIQAHISSHGRSLIESIHRAENAYEEEHRNLYTSRTCLRDITISLGHVLEANAITAELLHLLVAHGIDSADLYYKRVLSHLEPIYSVLLKTFVSHSHDLQTAIVALHLSASVALYLSDDPVAFFCTIAKEYITQPAAFFKRYNPALISGWFARIESKVEAYARSHRIVSAMGEPIFPGESDEGWYKDLIMFHDLVYDARKLLITKYIHEFEMDAKGYFDRTGELPLPPVVFWPGEVGPTGAVVSVSEEMLERGFGDIEKECYVIRGGLLHGRPMVGAGILRYMRRKTFVDLPLVDMHMLANYWFQALFIPGTEEVYSSVIDEVYEDRLHHYFGISTRPRIAMRDWKPHGQL